jgi:hypothetical protein
MDTPDPTQLLGNSFFYPSLWQCGRILWGPKIGFGEKENQSNRKGRRLAIGYTAT